MHEVLPLPPPPRPIRIGAPRLRVLQDGAQDCSTCANMTSCWASKGAQPLEAEAIVSNLLVCRIQRNIARDTSTRLFLSLIRPKLKQAARSVARTGMSADEAVRELESHVMVTLLERYVMGEAAPPIVWLFHDKLGTVSLWVRHTVRDANRQRDRYLSYSSSDTATSNADLETRITLLNRVASGHRVHGPPAALTPTVSEDPVESERCRVALDVLEDGLTLTTAEYRVMRFCLQNARGSERMTDWLHQHMAKVLGVTRSVVSRLYGLSYRRLLDAVGLRRAYLSAKGIEPSTSRRTFRGRLTAEEILQVIENGHAASLDVAWALGISDVAVKQLRRKYAGMTPDQIRITLE